MVYGVASWALTQKEEHMLHSSDRRTIGQMCGLMFRHRVASVEILRRCDLKVILVMVHMSITGSLDM